MNPQRMLRNPAIKMLRIKEPPISPEKILNEAASINWLLYNSSLEIRETSFCEYV